MDSSPGSLQVAFFLPQLVQLLRSDDNSMIKSFLLASADRSIVFAHHLVCTLKVSIAPNGYFIFLKSKQIRSEVSKT